MFAARGKWDRRWRLRHSAHSAQVWIHTTASLEGRVGRLPVPHILQRLIHAILAADHGAVGLVATPRAELLRGADEAPPTAIKVQSPASRVRPAALCARRARFGLGGLALPPRRLG